jgi:hypothetical protein
MHRSYGLGLVPRILIGMTLVAGVAGATQVFTASNTVTVKKAGDGAGTISGYTIASVAYSLNASNPQNIDAVTFTTNAAASTVRARLETSGSFYSCTTTNSPTNTAWSCTTTSPQATVANAAELRVVAVE